MKQFWTCAVLALLAPGPASAASGQLGFVCSGRTTLTRSGSDTSAYKTWDEAALVFDFDRRLVFHEDGAEGYPISDITRRAITWTSPDRGLEGRLNRLTLEAEEVRSQAGTLARNTYACRLTSYLDFRTKP
jgi:hypothetical protein